MTCSMIEILGNHPSNPRMPSSIIVFLLFLSFVGQVFQPRGNVLLVGTLAKNLERAISLDYCGNLYKWSRENYRDAACHAIEGTMVPLFLFSFLSLFFLPPSPCLDRLEADVKGGRPQKIAGCGVTRGDRVPSDDRNQVIDTTQYLCP